MNAGIFRLMFNMNIISTGEKKMVLLVIGVRVLVNKKVKTKQLLSTFYQQVQAWNY